MRTKQQHSATAKAITLNSNGHIRIVVLLVTFLAIAGSCYAVERFQIESGTNPDYLPYYLDSVQARDYGTCARPPGQVLRVVTPKRSSQNNGVVARAVNFCPPSEDQHRFTWMSYPDWSVLYETSVAFTIHDSRLYRDSRTATLGIVGVGFLEDSVFVYKAVPTAVGFAREQLCILAKDEQIRTRWVGPAAWIVELTDDGVGSSTKAYVFVGCVSGPRQLFCIDLDSMTIEWSLPVASPLSRGPVFVVHDSVQTFTIFSTLFNPANGEQDKEFDDRFMYFVILDDKGTILQKKILAANWEQVSFMCAGLVEREFYIVHALDFVDSVDSAAMQVRNHHLSRIDMEGTKLASVEMPGRPEWVEVIPYGEDQSPHVWVRFRERTLAIYDTALTLVAYCDHTDIRQFRARLKIAGQSDSVYAFTDGLYDKTLTKLLYFPYPTSSVESVAYDSSGNTVDILINGTNKFYIGKIRKKTYLNLASVFYHRNQDSVLVGMLILLSGLFVTSYARWKAKRKLEIVRLQQDALVAAEKYKQAKDIAGGFAHEIRNALFPADGLLTKVQRTQDPTTIEVERLKKYHKSIHSAISRAVGITDLISQYTKLDSEQLPENTDIVSSINAVVRANQFRIDQQKITIRLPKDDTVIIRANRKQIEIVVNNLLLNSLDALKDIATPTIDINLSVNSERIRLKFVDNGSGIAPEHKEKIFDAFYSTKPETGIGIGLSMVKRIVEMYDGQISVSSTLGQGATFELTFPTNENDHK